MPTSRFARRLDRARHEDRDQEHELVPLGPSRDRKRDRAPDRDARSGRAHHAGDARLGRSCAASRIRCAAKKKRTTTATSPIPISCRWRSRAASVERVRASAAGAAVAAFRTLHRRVRSRRQAGDAADRQSAARDVLRPRRRSEREPAAVDELRARRSLAPGQRDRRRGRGIEGDAASIWPS